MCPYVLCSVDDVVDESDDNEEPEADADTENDEDEKDHCSLVISTLCIKYFHKSVKQRILLL